jgi:hypothetical protein
LKTHEYPLKINYQRRLNSNFDILAGDQAFLADCENMVFGATAIVAKLISQNTQLLLSAIIV